MKTIKIERIKAAALAGGCAYVFLQLSESEC